MTENEMAKILGLTVPNEEDGKINGTIIRADPLSIDKSNAELQQFIESSEPHFGVWNEYDDIRI